MSKKLPTLKALSLTEWYKNYGDNPVASFYVLNISSQEANLIFNIETSNGTNNSVSVPFTFAPIDLTTYTPIASLLASEGLRKLINGRHIQIVDTAQVEAEALTNPIIRKELDRIFNADVAVSELASNGTSDSVDTSMDDDPLVASILSLSTEEADEVRLTSILHTRGKNLTDAALEYLRANSQSRALTEYVLDQLDERGLVD